MSWLKILNRTNNIKKVYKNASIYCMTSYVEGLPMVILEAMESGLPIIISEKEIEKKLKLYFYRFF